MTCKDCIHYDVCAINGIDVENTTFKKELCCGEFKDKSRIVELPCGFGDIVYTIPRRSIRKWRVVFIGLCESPYINIAWYKDKNHFETRSIYFDQIGKTVFLTKEEAEAKLKELNEK